METCRCIRFHSPSDAVADFQSSLVSCLAYSGWHRSVVATTAVDSSSYCNLGWDRLSYLSFSAIGELDDPKRYAVHRKFHHTAVKDTFVLPRFYELDPLA
jgi:hypothetical protein